MPWIPDSLSVELGFRILIVSESPDSFFSTRKISGFPNMARYVTSSETQGQIVGARESLNGRKNMARRRKTKERRVELLGTMSYQTSSKRSPPFWLLIRQKNTKVFRHQSEARTAATVWDWSGKTLSPGALLALLYFFSSCHIFRPFRLSFAPTICPWVSEDGYVNTNLYN